MPEYDPTPPTQLRMIQLNVNKSNNAQTDFLINCINPDHYDLVLLQEPYFDFKKDSRVSSKWTVIYPRKHLDDQLRTRSIILVNTKISTDSWSALPIDCPDITAIAIRGAWGTLRIFNIYNDCKHQNNITSLQQYLLHAEHDHLTGGALNDIWLGDFNLHSPLWDEPRNNHLFTPAATRNAQRLIDMAASWDMHMALQGGVNTLESTSTKNYT